MNSSAADSILFRKNPDRGLGCIAFGRTTEEILPAETGGRYASAAQRYFDMYSGAPRMGE